MKFSIFNYQALTKVEKKKIFFDFQFSKRGFTFIDVIVGTALVLIIFMGIFSAYQLGMKVVGQSKNKITATALANEQIEKIRNLPYESVGIIDGQLPVAVGVLASSANIFLNNVEYFIKRNIEYISDEADGIGDEDEGCDLDYKRAEIKVSWGGRFLGEVKMVTDIAPKNKFEEIASCEAQPGGILSVNVFDAYGIMVVSPLIEVFEAAAGELIASYMPLSGKKDIPLATSTYKVLVSKTGYSTDKTYGTDEITTPIKPHPIILEKQTTEISFSIDKVSVFSVNTLSPWGEDFWADSFQNTSKISEMENVVVAEGEAKLATTTEGYYPSGFLISTEISPTNSLNWNEFVFTDSEPIDTDLKYQIYYATNTSWMLIPDADLAGNSEGFNESPVDLSDLDPTVYSQLKLRADFSTNTSISTPILEHWQVSWITSEATPIPNVTSNLRGAKLIGYDVNEAPVYKYSQNFTSINQGQIDIVGLEWDNYTFSVDTETGLNLVGIDPEPQPIGLIPDTILQVNLYLESENSLLVTVQNIETLELIFSAAVRLFNSGLGYDTTQYTNEKGQTYFISLTATTYNLEVQAPGCLDYEGQVSVSGNTTKTVRLERVE